MNTLFKQLLPSVLLLVLCGCAEMPAVKLPAQDAAKDVPKPAPVAAVMDEQSKPDESGTPSAETDGDTVVLGATAGAVSGAVGATQ